jgi:hypothetical protein
MSFTIHTASAAPSEMEIAAATGRLHAEHLLQILTTTSPDRRDAIVEGAKIRLGRFVSDNMPAGAPAQEILDAANDAFDAVVGAQ